MRRHAFDHGLEYKILYASNSKGCLAGGRMGGRVDGWMGGWVGEGEGGL